MSGLLRRVSQPVPLFLILGTLLFAVDHWRSAGQTTLTVRDADLARMAAQWQAQMGQPATPAVLADLVDAWVAEELLVREARAMGLDQGDTIVRRRLVQKLQFLAEDNLPAATGAELQDWFRQHPQRWQQPATVTFRHSLFSRDRHPDAMAVAAAHLADVPVAGDPTLLPGQLVAEPLAGVAELFGDEFAAALARQAPGQWQGPVASPYGAHLVLLQHLQPARPLAFAEARALVLADLTAERRRQAHAALLARLRQGVQVHLPAAMAAGDGQ